jgi:hypothetical protein
MLNKIKEQVKVLKEVWNSEELTKVLKTAKEKINYIDAKEKNEKETLKAMKEASKEYNNWEKKLLRQYVIGEIKSIYKKKKEENKETRLTIFDF